MLLSLSLTIIRFIKAYEKLLLYDVNPISYPINIFPSQVLTHQSSIRDALVLMISHYLLEFKSFILLIMKFVTQPRLISIRTLFFGYCF
jgi:hypothetical protein